MEDQYKRGAVALWGMNTVGAIKGLWWRVATVPWLRFVAACGAFMGAWRSHSEWDINTKTEVVEDDEEFNDEIPF